MVKLVERALVKDLLRLPRADTLQDGILNGMIEQCSAQVERITRREFTYAARVEYHRSYEQTAVDPEPQYITLNAFPVDTDETFLLQWSPHDHRTGHIIDLSESNEDYELLAEKGMVVVRTAGGIVNNLPLLGSIIFSYAPRGFKVTYTGGYAVSEHPGGDPDPLDDYDVVQVPDSLKQVVAQKVALDFQAVRMLRAFTDDERKSLSLWEKKDMI